MDGFDAAKKKKDFALRQSKIQMGYSNAYTVPKLQYSQFNNFMKNGRCRIRCMLFIIIYISRPVIFGMLAPAGRIDHFSDQGIASAHYPLITQAM
jgi:hypothetical protein